MTTFGATLRRACALTVAFGAALQSAPARAQTPAPAAPAEPPPGSESLLPAQVPLAESLTGEAKAEYESGKLLFEHGDFAAAAVKFQHAYELGKDPRLLWNVAAAEKQLRHYARVEVLLTEYLNMSGPTLSASDMQNALDLLETIKAFIADLKLNVNEAGATVSVDDVERGRTPLARALRVDIGPRKIRVAKSGFQDFVVTRTVVGGEEEVVDVTLAPVVHEGRLRISAPAGASVRVDGKLVGLGEWEGRLPSGTHQIEVSADKKQPWRSDGVVRDGQLTTVIVSLQAESQPEATGIPNWVWIAGGSVALAGLGVGGYFLFKPEDEGPPPPVEGTWASVELAFTR